MCSFRHDEEQDGIDSSSDGSNGGRSGDSDGSSEEEEEESGDGDARYRKKPGMLMMVRQEAPQFAVDGGNSSGARGLNEVRWLNGHCCCHPLTYRMPAPLRVVCSVACFETGQSHSCLRKSLRAHAYERGDVT